ncbi:Zinc resistance conferring protein [Vanrija albida]|uniref:Zinc resistance conferring protein n=1 Tax=Vanrija albida TaxID=181172 RepID=A0ABR3PZ13_9TREE
MGLSRQARIITLLVIDTAFFFLELIVGYAVGSLALVADSFHMLNDVLSLIVALYTIKLATSPSSAENSYGWQRAEILGALINGVFLIALCSTIALEAIGRIVSPPEITNPRLIVLVGSLGLLSNIVGLILFHEHGHSHGGHSHGPVALPVEADEPLDQSSDAVAVRRKRADSIDSLYQHPAETRAQIIEAAHGLSQSVDETSFLSKSPRDHTGRHPSISRRNYGSVSRTRSSGGVTQINKNVKAPNPGSNETIPPPSSGEDSSSAGASTAVDETAVNTPNNTDIVKANDHDHDHDHADSADAAERGGNHAGHNHGAGGHGHGHGSHGSMNMHGVFLHVLGDALGNVGVIAAGLVIWFFEGRWTLYFDPGVSLLITVIIFNSALPLVKSASAILMQGVPTHVSLEDVRKAIKSVPGVVSVHELHVWQLSETTVVASVHVLILRGFDYMQVANEIRHVLHSHGIHSVTIQPEFSDAANDSDDEADAGERSCLIRCPPEQCVADTCCPPVAEERETPSNSSSHSH